MFVIVSRTTSYLLTEAYTNNMGGEKQAMLPGVQQFDDAYGF